MFFRTGSRRNGDYSINKKFVIYHVRGIQFGQGRQVYFDQDYKNTLNIADQSSTQINQYKIQTILNPYIQNTPSHQKNEKGFTFPNDNEGLQLFP